MLFVNYRSLLLKRKSIIRALYIIRRNKLGTRERDQQKHLLKLLPSFFFELCLQRKTARVNHILHRILLPLSLSLSPVSFCRPLCQHALSSLSSLLFSLKYLAVLHFYTDLLPKSFSHLFLSFLPFLCLLYFIFSHLSNYISLLPLCLLCFLPNFLSVVISSLLSLSHTCTAFARPYDFCPNLLCDLVCFHSNYEPVFCGKSDLDHGRRQQIHFVQGKVTGYFVLITLPAELQLNLAIFCIISHSSLKSSSTSRNFLKQLF